MPRIMTADDVLEIARLFDQKGIEFYVDGGWAVDILLGEQTRPHADLDLAIQHKDVPSLRSLLEARGYRELPRDDSWECNFVLGDDVGREVDVHSYTFDSSGNLAHGVAYPIESLSGEGTLRGHRLRCISPEWLVRFHTGYALDENDYRDVMALCRRFGLNPPSEYARSMRDGGPKSRAGGGEPGTPIPGADHLPGDVATRIEGMSQRCPECKAAFASGEKCRDRFDALQLKELEQPGYYAVHHLSVPCYMLQHNVYSREGWIEVRALLDKFVRDGWTPAMARRLIRRTPEIQRRTWSFTKGSRLTGVEKIAWKRTIADIRLDTAEHYCEDVRCWAEQILTDSEGLLREAGGRPKARRR
jgi:lincosamide nucleotidyltransferase A/C/D/E